MQAELTTVPPPIRRAMIDDYVLTRLVELNKSVFKAVLIHVIRIMRTNSFRNLAAGYSDISEYLAVQGLNLPNSTRSDLMFWAQTLVPELERLGEKPEELIADAPVANLRTLVPVARRILSNGANRKGERLKELVEDATLRDVRGFREHLHPPQYTPTEDVPAWNAYVHRLPDETYLVVLHLKPGQLQAFQRAALRPVTARGYLPPEQLPRLLPPSKLAGAELRDDLVEYIERS